MNTEELLPKEILAKASLHGNEYAWRQEDTTEAILAAKNANLGTLGGEVQFHLPEGIVELYWMSFDPADKAESEPWLEYVARSADECTDQLGHLCKSTDFIQLAKENGIFRENSTKGDIEKYLYFVLYFVTEEQYNDLDRRSQAKSS